MFRLKGKGGERREVICLEWSVLSKQRRPPGVCSLNLFLCLNCFMCMSLWAGCCTHVKTLWSGTPASDCHHPLRVNNSFHAKCRSLTNSSFKCTHTVFVILSHTPFSVLTQEFLPAGKSDLQEAHSCLINAFGLVRSSNQVFLLLLLNNGKMDCTLIPVRIKIHVWRTVIILTVKGKEILQVSYGFCPKYSVVLEYASKTQSASSNKI